MLVGQKSRKIFHYGLFIVGLALTGCATGRYDNTHSPGTGITPAQLRLARPVEGTVVVPFGARESGVLSKGVWIEGRAGSPVSAAADGRAVFADARMEGYGKTVILEHEGGFWTVYAHLAEITVREGDAVRRGIPVGKLDARNKRLYFEFRRGDRAEDPARSWK